MKQYPAVDGVCVSMQFMKNNYVQVLLENGFWQ